MDIKIQEAEKLSKELTKLLRKISSLPEVEIKENSLVLNEIYGEIILSKFFISRTIMIFKIEKLPKE